MHECTARFRLARDGLSRLCVVLSESRGVQAPGLEVRSRGRAVKNEAIMKRETVEVVQVVLAATSGSREKAHAGLADAGLARNRAHSFQGYAEGKRGKLAKLCWRSSYLRDAAPETAAANGTRRGWSGRWASAKTPPETGFQKSNGAGTLSIVPYALSATNNPVYPHSAPRTKHRWQCW
jgi:hypothetical protein